MVSKAIVPGGRRFICKDISRRDFLKIGGAGLAGAALLGVAGCGGGSEVGGATELTFSFFPDRTGSVQALIDQFNSENEGEIQVTLREMPAVRAVTSILRVEGLS